MSVAPYRPCPHPRCGVLTRGGLCTVHKRASTQRRQYPASWASYSRAFLAEHAHCGDRDASAPRTTDSRCAALGLHVRATQTDHIDPIGGDLSRLFDRANLQALCTSCHSRKTATTRGAYGRN